MTDLLWTWYLQVPMKVPCFFRVLFGMCLYVQKLGVDVHILCHSCAHTLWWYNKCFLWIMCLFEGLSSSNLILLSTFNIQIFEMW